MSDNPYQSPQPTDAAVGVLSGKREDLRKVAQYQRGVLVCILVYLMAVVFQFIFPPELWPLVAVAGLGAGIVGAVFVFLLAIQLYGIVGGILMGVLTLVPCLGLLLLLLINERATRVLRQNGIRVGLLGADPSQL